jgi:hypothetical protein
MNPLIKTIFTGLELPNEYLQARSVVKLVMLLERAKNRPEMNEECCRIFLPEELIELKLSPDDINEVFSFGFDKLKSYKLLRGTKLSLFWLLADMGEQKHGDAFLEFFSEFAGSFNEQEAFSSLAVLKLFFRRHEAEVSGLWELLERHNFVPLVQGFPMESSRRLRQSVANLFRYLETLRTQA